MAEIEVQPFVMKNAVVELGETPDDFAKAVSSAALTPAGGTVPFKGLKPSAIFTFPTAATYTLDLTYAQDWSTEESLSRWLYDHRGQVVDCVLDADDTSLVAGTKHTTWTMRVAIAPGAVGGAVDTVAVATVSLGVVGEPVPALVDANAQPENFRTGAELRAEEN